MTLAIILCFTLWTATLLFAFWWSERRYQDGYHDGYSDAEAWAQRGYRLSEHEWKGGADGETAFFGGEP